MSEHIQTIEKLHTQYAGVLYDKCVRILGDRVEAEDAVQETFLSAYRALDRFSLQESYLPWLYRIATNVCLKFIRTRKRKGMTLLEEMEHIDAKIQLQGDVAISRQILSKLLNKLDERGMQLFVAHYIDGMDQGQTAQAIGISRRAVVKRLTKLRNELEHIMEDGHE